MNRIRHSRPGLLLGALTALALILTACSSSGGGDSDDSASPDEGEVVEGDIVMIDIAFNPDDITVSLDDTVVWVNDDSVQHTATRGSDGTSDDGFDSDVLSQGEAFAWTADQEGEVQFTCTIHPQMNGTITVEPA